MSSRSELFRTQYKPFLASNRDGLYQPWFSVIESFNARENRAFVGRIYAGFMYELFHCLVSIHVHSCVVFGRLMKLLFSLITLERVWQIYLCAEQICSHTYSRIM